MTKKHTPGPWRVGKAGPNMCPTVGTHKGLMVAMVSHGDNHPTQANARLIAAAPEMLEALQALLRFAENTESELGIVLGSANLARSAIAKATGE